MERWLVIKWLVKIILIQGRSIFLGYLFFFFYSQNTTLEFLPLQEHSCPVLSYSPGVREDSLFSNLNAFGRSVGTCCITAGAICRRGAWSYCLCPRRPATVWTRTRWRNVATRRRACWTISARWPRSPRWFAPAIWCITASWTCTGACSRNRWTSTTCAAATRSRCSAATTCWPNRTANWLSSRTNRCELSVTLPRNAAASIRPEPNFALKILVVSHHLFYDTFLISTTVNSCLLIVKLN